MSEADIARRLVEALADAAQREAGLRTGLVSVSIEILAHETPDRIEVQLERKTRTLLFQRADAFAGDVRAATAASIHKVLD